MNIKINKLMWPELCSYLAGGQKLLHNAVHRGRVDHEVHVPNSHPEFKRHRPNVKFTSRVTIAIGHDQPSFYTTWQPERACAHTHTHTLIRLHMTTQHYIVRRGRGRGQRHVVKVPLWWRQGRACWWAAWMSTLGSFFHIFMLDRRWALHMNNNNDNNNNNNNIINLK